MVRLNRTSSVHLEGDIRAERTPTSLRIGYLTICAGSDVAISKVWPIISNKEAIAVNQAWAGHPGFKAEEVPNVHQVWAKPLPSGSLAVLVINLSTQPQASITVDLSKLGAPVGARGRDVWAHKDLGVVGVSWDVPALSAHDPAFVVFSN